MHFGVGTLAYGITLFACCEFMEHVFAVLILGLHDEKMHSLHHLQFMMIPPTWIWHGASHKLNPGLRTAPRNAAELSDCSYQYRYNKLGVTLKN